MDAQKIFSSIDKTLIYIIFALLAFSIVLGASTFVGLENSFSVLSNFFKHLVIIVVSVILMFFFSTIDLSIYRNYAKAIFIVFGGIFVLTYLIGMTVNSATRWIQIPIIGISFQPSEFLRIAFVIFVAKMISEADQDSEDFKSVVKKILLWTFLIMAAIAFSNFSSGVIVFMVVFTMLFITSITYKQFFKYLGIFLLALIVAFAIAYVFKIGRTETVVSRSLSIGKESSYSQKTQALVAISSAHFVPHPGSSKQKFILPNAESDYVFSIAIEEYGVLGLVFIIGFYIIILFRIGKIISSQTKAFPTYLAIGLAANIIIQTVVHMFVNVGIGPVTGQPLPLLSRGGSSIMATLIEFGIILQISTNLYGQNTQNSSVSDDNDNLNFDENNFNSDNENLNSSYAQNTYVTSQYDGNPIIEDDYFSKYTDNSKNNNENYSQNTYNPVVDNSVSNNSFNQYNSDNNYSQNTYNPVVDNSVSNNSFNSDNNYTPIVSDNLTTNNFNNFDNNNQNTDLSINTELKNDEDFDVTDESFKNFFDTNQTTDENKSNNNTINPIID